MSRDQLFSKPLGQISGFEFDQRVVSVFPDMIQRSVPGYESVVAMTGVLAARSSRAGSNIYDLGCSLGASTLSICAKLPEQCSVIAVDNSEAMVNEFQNLLKGQPEQNLIQIELADVRDIEIKNASMVVLNFTLQFIPLEDRLTLIKRIYQGMLPGGVLLVSEKIRIEDTQLNDLFIDAHHEFKKRQGYSELEVAQKRSAIENVLIPETQEQHFERFQQAGFNQSSLWFQCLNFCSMIAIKAPY